MTIGVWDAYQGQLMATQNNKDGWRQTEACGLKQNMAEKRS